MRAAFCSSPPADGPGPLPGTRQSSLTTIGMTVSPLWPPLRSRPNASIWGCTSASSRATFRPSMWPASCVRSCNTCGATSSCSGTVARFTGGLPSRRCARLTLDCIWKSSRRMRRSSIPRSRCGTTSKPTPRTACFGIDGISAIVCLQTPDGSGAHRRSCGRSSAAPSCHLHRDNILITCAKPNNCQSS
jgi:hypothetical protein